MSQPEYGGVSRRRFWIPAHVACERTIIVALVVVWSQLPLLGLISHVLMRIWSALDFIPTALAFERADAAAITETAARRWTRRGRWRAG